MNSKNNTRRRARRLTPALGAIATSLALAACGSSSTSTTSTSASASSSSGSTATRTAVEECLKKHGFSAPVHVPGSGTGARPTGTPPAGATGAGGANSSIRQAAFKACGVTPHFGGSATTSDRNATPASVAPTTTSAPHATA
jgi:hypothetical protein